MITTIIVPLDADPQSGRAVPVAGAVARRTGATIELLTVDPAGLEAGPSAAHLDDLTHSVPPGVGVTTTVAPTTVSVAETLAQLQRGPGALICMATHGRGAIGSLLHGSVADAVVRDATVPVLLVGPACAAEGQSWPEEPTVAALDGSDLDDDVLAAAASWAQAMGSELVVATVVTTPSDPAVWALADERLARAEARARDIGVSSTSSVAGAADGADGLVRLVGPEAGCLVVGSHRRRSLGRVVLGSTVDRLVRHVEIPILVAGRPVHPPSDPPSDLPADAESADHREEPDHAHHR